MQKISYKCEASIEQRTYFAQVSSCLTGQFRYIINFEKRKMNGVESAVKDRRKEDWQKK